MAYLVLENGKIFEGVRFGANRDAIGELVFNTGVVGYPEILCDSRNSGNIVVQTFPLMGNYGIIDSDLTREPSLSAYVVREVCTSPSNFRCERDLDSYLKEKGIPAICGVDTRELTCELRREGAMMALLCDTLPEDIGFIAEHKAPGSVQKASAESTKSFAAKGEKQRRAVLVDFGVSEGEIEALTSRGCEVIRVPYDTTAEEIMNLSPDGVVLSAGPGDPEEMTDPARQVRALFGRVPLFGVGLGHQVAAIAAGGRTYKMKCGHRGTNQPVTEAGGSRTYITSQNHGYAVCADSLKGTADVYFTNANDGTCEGLHYPGKKCFTVQFIPDAEPSTAGTAFLYDRFTELMDESK